jgi:phosphoglycerol transferase MdoB-like AlkP superfamily enzyme
MEQELMSVSFIFLVPIALGFVTVWYSPEKWRMKWWYAAVMPWLAAFLFLAGAMLANLEGLICVVFFFLLLGLWAVWAGCARESLREPMPKQMPKHLRPAKP